MKAGLGNRGYEFNTRENSLGKLPPIDSTYRPHYNPPVTGGRSSNTEHADMVYNQRRSKSWRRSEEEQASIRAPLRKENKSNFSHNHEEHANSSRFTQIKCSKPSNVYQSTRTTTGGGTGATCDAPSVKSYAKVY